MYSCETCGVLDAECEVVPRKAGQGVVEWFEGMLEEVKAHHWLGNPACQTKELKNIKVPCRKDAEGIGFEPAKK